MNSKKYEIEMLPVDKLKRLDYVDLEHHYDGIMQDCAEIIEYLKNIRHRLLIYYNNDMEDENDRK